MNTKNSTIELGADMDVPVKLKPLVSQVQMRIKVQKILEDNMQQAIGRFHCKELNETCFLNDLFKKFTLTPKE